MDATQLKDLVQLAWRNSPRCIGRLFWHSLEVLDARSASSADEVFDACVHHLRYSTNGGRIRPAVTVFAEEDQTAGGIRIWNPQLIRYAGYRRPNGTVLGDPLLVEFTARLIELGWQPPQQRTQFDILPLAIKVPGQPLFIRDLPKDAVLEVPLSHPDFNWFGDLCLKWHALPAVSDMALVSDQKRHTAVPFSGHYMGTEIGARNLGDEGRYNLLSSIATRMGLDLANRTNLWKDRALVELNAAVLHSFNLAGVTIVDHHTASVQFMQHLEVEARKGRIVPGDWSWLVPPLSGSTCPVFHRYYDSTELEPAFVHLSPAWLD
jgi:nitric-oxide synthase, bacterial